MQANEKGKDTSTSVRAARDAYLAENGFSLTEYDAETAKVRVLGRDLTLTNPPARRRAIPLHDLHHVATGYGTDLVGEGEIGAWELGAGCRTAIVYVLNIVATTIGLCLAPRRMWAAFRAGLGQRTLYRASCDYTSLLKLDVAGLRAMLGVPMEGLATHPRRLHEAAPSRLREAS